MKTNVLFRNSEIYTPDIKFKMFKVFICTKSFTLRLLAPYKIETTYIPLLARK